MARVDVNKRLADESTQTFHYFNVVDARSLRGKGHDSRTLTHFARLEETFDADRVRVSETVVDMFEKDKSIKSIVLYDDGEAVASAHRTRLMKKDISNAPTDT